MRKTYLSRWYWKVKQRRGGKKALIALARKILTIIYAILKNEGSSYNEELYQVLQDRNLEHRQEKLIKELVSSGFVVTHPARIVV
jgi:predicted transcriptional regulator